jgi:hypothetical protein
MSIVFESVHADDLDPALNEKGKVVKTGPYRVQTLTINRERAEARRTAAIRESIAGSAKHASEIGAGQAD